MQNFGLPQMAMDALQDVTSRALPVLARRQDGGKLVGNALDTTGSPKHAGPVNCFFASFWSRQGARGMSA